MRAAPLAALALLAALPAWADAPRGFGDWWAACDNRAHCTLIGLPARVPEGRIPLALRVESDADAADGFRLSLLPLGRESGAPFTLVDPPLTLRAGRADLTERQAAALMPRLAAGQRLEVNSGAPALLPDATRFQAAFNTLTELRVLAVLARAMPGVIHGPPALARPAREVEGPSPAGLACPADVTQGAARGFALPGGAQLWSIACGPRQHWFGIAHATAPAIPLQLPDGERPVLEAGRAGLTESSFEFDFGVLRAQEGPPGREDCGAARTWGWTGQGWRLLERREMPACAGLHQADWPRTYVAR